MKKRSKVTHQISTSSAGDDELDDSKHEGKFTLGAILNLFYVIFIHKFIPKSSPVSTLLCLALEIDNY